MNLFLAAALVAVATGLAIAAMLFVRRRAPEGSFFSDGDRASGVFGVLATGFSILLGFVVFLAFSTYDTSRAGADVEAVTIFQQVETAQFFPPEVSGKLTGELVCYGRAVVHEEWPRMEAGTLGDSVNPWGIELFRTIEGVEPRTAREQSRVGTPVKRANLAPGDLVFYNTRNQPYSHVGMYVGNGRFVHAPKPGAKVRIERLDTPYWRARYNGGRRLDIDNYSH